MKKNVLAFDLGASSGRAIMGAYENGKLYLEEISRFAYEPLMIDGKMHWDISLIFTSIKNAIRKATDNHHIDSLAIDTWGVDYGLLDEKGDLIEAPVHYRDPRTNGMLEEVTKLVSEDELYEMTGNQLMEINTLFQLKATAIQEPEKLSNAKTLLLMPDLLNYLLTGEKKTEMSIASTTQLLNPVTRKWNQVLIEKLDLPLHLFTEIVKEGEVLGKIKPDLSLPPLSVYHVCAHDTASAFASSAGDASCLFVSCGTWSLIGTEQLNPVITEKSNYYNLTNESGINQTIRLLKNITGLWIIQELQREFDEAGKAYTYSDFELMAEEAPEFSGFIDVEDEIFSPSGKMSERICAFLKKTGQKIPETDGQMIRIVYESLAFKYKAIFLEIEDTMGTSFLSVNMVGGGIQSEILCTMVANASGLSLLAGPIEATALGNIAVQLMAHGCFEGVSQMREWVRAHSETKTYLPQQVEKWELNFERYKEIVSKGVKIRG